MYTHGIFGVDVDSRVPMGALREALFPPQGIAVGFQLLNDLGRVIYCPGHMVNAGAVLCQVFSLPGARSGLRDLNLGVANLIQSVFWAGLAASSRLLKKGLLAAKKTHFP
jgi:hypothetical protein